MTGDEGGWATAKILLGVRMLEGDSIHMAKRLSDMPQASRHLNGRQGIQGKQPSARSVCWVAGLITAKLSSVPIRIRIVVPSFDYSG